MNDAEYETQKARVKALVDRWIKPLGLGWWTIHIFYEREPLTRHSDLAPGWTALFETTALWQYATATITAYLPDLADESDDDLDELFLHELGHILVCELRQDEDRRAHEERVATMLAKAFCWLRRHCEAEEGAVGPP